MVGNGITILTSLALYLSHLGVNTILISLPQCRSSFSAAYSTRRI